MEDFSEKRLAYSRIVLSLAKTVLTVLAIGQSITLFMSRMFIGFFVLAKTAMGFNARLCVKPREEDDRGEA